MTRKPTIVLWTWPTEPEALRLLGSYDGEGYLIFCTGFSSWGQVFRLVETLKQSDNP